MNEQQTNYPEVLKLLEKAPNGAPLSTTANYLTIFRNDVNFKNVFLDIMKMTACRVLADGKRVYWSDADDARTRMHMEQAYKLRSAAKINDAFEIFLSEREFSPVQEIIKGIQWDGKPHVESLYSRWLRADDTAYTREVTRIDFLQRIERAFSPGCKADYVIVLKGKQGTGKSTFVRWSALEDELYASITTIEGQKGCEAVQGKFVCELEELVAIAGEGMRKEGVVKGFISRQSDHYRRPYDRRTSDNLRSCVFVGTTNHEKFLTDLTGNRRWFPIECRLDDGGFLYEHEQEIRTDIRMAYSEMYYAWVHHLPLAKPIIDRSLWETIKTKQEESELDDFRVGLIADYLKKSKRKYTCCLEIWNEVLKPYGGKEYTKSYANEIGSILRNKLGCVDVGKKYIPGYETQHAFKVPQMSENTE